MKQFHSELKKLLMTKYNKLEINHIAQAIRVGAGMGKGATQREVMLSNAWQSYVRNKDCRNRQDFMVNLENYLNNSA